MNAAYLLMSTAWMAGADAAPAPAPAPAPVIVHAAPVAGCGNCAVGINPCCGDPNPERKGLLRRLLPPYGIIFGRDKNKAADCCAPAPCSTTCNSGCGAPVFTGFTTACCDPCADHKDGLLARLKAKFSRNNECCASSCGGCGATGGCALPPVPGSVTSPPTSTPPVEMPKPKDPPKTTTGSSASLSIPSIVAPVANPSTPVLGGSKSPF